MYGLEIYTWANANKENPPIVLCASSLEQLAQQFFEYISEREPDWARQHVLEHMCSEIKHTGKVYNSPGWDSAYYVYIQPRRP